MSYTYLLVVLEYLLFSLHFKEYLCQQPSVATACNGNSLQISCLDNEKIAINRIFFGAKPKEPRLDCKAEGETDPACCQRGYRDCIDYNSNTDTIVKRLCTGRQNCLYLTRSVDIDRCPDPTLDKSDYMTVYYSCIPDNSTVNICSDDKIQAKPPLYLSNKEYPLPRTGFSNCTCMVVKHPSQPRLALRAIEISFIDPQCSVSLTVGHGEDSEERFPCNYKMGSFRQWTEMTSATTTISLTNVEDQGDAYLWMQIGSPDGSEDPVSLYCGEALKKFLYPDSTSTDQTTTSTTAPPVTTMKSTVTTTETSKMTSTVKSTTEEDMITRSGTSTSYEKSPNTKRTTMKTQSTTLKSFSTQSTTIKPIATQSTARKSMATQSTTRKPVATKSSTTRQEMTNSTLSKTKLTTKKSTSPFTFTSLSTTQTTSRFVPSLSTTTITTQKPRTTTVPMDSSSSDLVISPQTKYCYGTCHETVGHGFTLNLKSFINPSKAKKYCRKINDLLSCFESNSDKCSSTDKMDADKELKANLAGRQVICEENLSEVQYMVDCYNKKNFRRELSSCDQLLYPFENIDKTERCKLKEDLVDCVRDVVEDCNDTTVSKFMDNVTNGLFDYLYKTDDCDKELNKTDNEPEVMVTKKPTAEQPKVMATEKPTPEPEVDDGTQPSVIPEKKAGDDTRNTASLVRGLPYLLHILLIANLMIFLS